MKTQIKECQVGNAVVLMTAIEEQKTWSPAEKELAAACLTVVRATCNLAEGYRVLCVHARSAQLSPAEIRKVMTASGFSGSRISEVIRVVSAPDAIWTEYATAQIGLQKSLELVRYGGQDVQPPELEQTEQQKKQTVTKQKRANALARILLTKCVKWGVKTIDMRDGIYTLTIAVGKSHGTKKENEASQ